MPPVGGVKGVAKVVTPLNIIIKKSPAIFADGRATKI